MTEEVTTSETEEAPTVHEDAPQSPPLRLKDTNKRRIERLEKQILILATYLQAVIDKLQEDEEKKKHNGLILPQ